VLERQTRELAKKGQKIMYLPYIKVTAQEDSIGNLQLWRGDNTPKPDNDCLIAYIQTSQVRDALFEYCFDLSEDDKEDLQKGYTVVLNLDEELACDLLPC